MKFAINDTAAYAYTGAKPLVASQPTAVFIHGAANDHCVWALQSRYFAHHGWSALAIDLPGHGQSDGEPGTSIESLAQFVAAFLDSANVKHAAVFGHSMGAHALVQAAAFEPARFRQLVLIDPVIRSPADYHQPPPAPGETGARKSAGTARAGRAVCRSPHSGRKGRRGSQRT